MGGAGNRNHKPESAPPPTFAAPAVVHPPQRLHARRHLRRRRGLVLGQREVAARLRPTDGARGCVVRARRLLGRVKRPEPPPRADRRVPDLGRPLAPRPLADAAVRLVLAARHDAGAVRAVVRLLAAAGARRRRRRRVVLALVVLVVVVESVVHLPRVGLALGPPLREAGGLRRRSGARGGRRVGVGLLHGRLGKGAVGEGRVSMSAWGRC